MSDSLASERTLERPSDNGQVERASEAQPQSDTGGQTSDNGKSAQDENIRKLQSTYDKKLTQLQREMQQRDQYINSLTQQMRDAQRNAAPDDYSKLEVELQWERQEKQALAQRLAGYEQERQAQAEKQNALREIAEEFGVPVKALEEADDYKSAVKLALRAQAEAEQRKQRQDDDKRERNMPDLGGGKPRTMDSAWDEAYEAARQRRDSVEMARLLRTRGKT
jgi:hypothetical protein